MTKFGKDQDNVPVEDKGEDECSEPLAPMTFNMPRAWHTRFKIRAIKRGITMKALLIESFDAWEEKHDAK